MDLSVRDPRWPRAADPALSLSSSRGTPSGRTRASEDPLHDWGHVEHRPRHRQACRLFSHYPFLEVDSRLARPPASRTRRRKSPHRRPTPLPDPSDRYPSGFCRLSFPSPSARLRDAPRFLSLPRLPCVARILLLACGKTHRVWCIPDLCAASSPLRDCAHCLCLHQSLYVFQVFVCLRQLTATSALFAAKSVISFAFVLVLDCILGSSGGYVCM